MNVKELMWWTIGVSQFGLLMYISFVMSPEQAAAIFKCVRYL
jgi:hypothetical protein